MSLARQKRTLLKIMHSASRIIDLFIQTEQYYLSRQLIFFLILYLRGTRFHFCTAGGSVTTTIRLSHGWLHLCGECTQADMLVCITGVCCFSEFHQGEKGYSYCYYNHFTFPMHLQYRQRPWQCQKCLSGFFENRNIDLLSSCLQ